jgi:hypothetical protein
MTRTELRDVVRDAVARALGAVGLCGIALIHVLDLPGKFDETPYLGAMYVALILGACALAAAMIWTGERSVWAAAAALAASVLLGYPLSRTTGLPQAHDDIGNWWEPLGIASLFVEGAVLALGSAILWSRRQQPARRQTPRALADADARVAA